MSDDSIAIQDPYFFLDEQWENDILSDDEEFPSFSQSQSYSASVSNSTQFVGGSIEGLDQLIGGTSGGNQGAFMGELAGGNLVEQVEEILAPLGSPSSPQQRIQNNSSPSNSFVYNNFGNTGGQLNIPNTHPNHPSISHSASNSNILSQTSVLATGNESRRRSLQALRSPVSSSPISANSNLSPHLKRTTTKPQDKKVEKIPERISLTWDSYYQYYSRNYSHSTVLTSQDRAKTPFVNSKSTGRGNLSVPIDLSGNAVGRSTTHSTFSNSTMTIDNHYKQQYIDTGNSAQSNIFSSHQPFSESMHSIGIPAALSDFEEDSFLYSQSVKSNLNSNSQVAFGSTKWQEIALDKLWKDTLGSSSRTR